MSIESSQPKSSAAGVAWNLSALFNAHDDPRIEKSIAAAQRSAKRFASAWRGKIKGKPSTATLLSALREYEAIQEDATRIGAYAHLLFAADTRPDAHRQLLQRVESTGTALRNALLFFDLEWLEVPEAHVKKLLADPKLANYKHYLTSERKYKPHTLSEPEEKLSNEKSLTGIGAWQKLHTELMAGMRFPITRDGETREVNQGEALTMMRVADRATRRAAWDGFYDVLAKNSQVLSYIYDTRFNDYLINNRLRRYKSHSQPRHMANGIDGKAVDVMLDVVRQNHGLAHRYWRLKARLLGMERLELYDQYAPLLDVKEKIAYRDAQTLILDALGRFSPEFSGLAARFFDSNWIDADPRDGKRGGAFCAGVTPATHPLILMSYNDSLRDVMTLAHELGHGMHDLLASRQTLLNYHPSLPVAETASVFAEMLVFDASLARLKDDRDRLALICSKIEDSFSTVYRQVVITQFEQGAYDARSKGRVSGKDLGEIWLRVNAEYYGDAVAMTPGYEWGWSYIPHMINTPFYCYAYAFGDLLVKALYGMYRREGDSFIPKYKALLASGGSRTPREQTRAMGVDINKAAFWQVGFDEMNRWVGEAERLAGVVGKQV
jgi:oligoendopeptidase F